MSQMKQFFPLLFVFLRDKLGTSGWFFPWGFFENFLTEAEGVVAVQAFWKLCIPRAQSVLWESLSLDDLYFLQGSSSEPALSNFIEEKRVPCLKDAETHLLLYCLVLVSMQFIVRVVGRVWMQNRSRVSLSHMCCSLLKNWNVCFPFWIDLAVSWLHSASAIRALGR